jgi:CDGSH-type Zn-finger protein
MTPPSRNERVADDVTITPYRDGPLLVRGPFRLLDQDGNPIDARRETIALCRCGKSRMRPFCDGTHKLVRFKAPSGPENGRADETIGGSASGTRRADD